MPEEKENKKHQRELLSMIILFGSLFAVFGLALAVILVDKSKTITIFNMVLPVVASWVGTILAFYFGRENFESANKQVRDIMQKTGDIYVLNSIIGHKTIKQTWEYVESLGLAVTSKAKIDALNIL